MICAAGALAERVPSGHSAWMSSRQAGRWVAGVGALTLLASCGQESVSQSDTTRGAVTIESGAVASVRPTSSEVTTSTTQPEAAPESSADNAPWSPEAIENPEPLPIDEVPRLVVDAPGLPTPRVVVRPVVSPDANGFLQVFTNADGTGWLHVETYDGTTDLPTGVESAAIGPWSVFTFPQTQGDGMLALQTDAVSVTLWSNTLSNEELRSIGARLAPAQSGPGWDLGDLSLGLAPVSSGPMRSWEARLVTYTDQELVVAVQTNVDTPELLSTYFRDYGDAGLAVIDFDGRRALLSDNGQGPTLIWEYAPRVVVRLGAPGANLDQLLTLARSVRALDQTDWDAIDSFESTDGCPSLWC